MSIRATCAAALAVFLVAPAADAKPLPRPHIEDMADDANFANGQGLQDGPPGQPTGDADVSSYDILSVRFQSYRELAAGAGRRAKRVVKGFHVTMTLSAPPGTEGFYRVRTRSGRCGKLWLQYGSSSAGQRSEFVYECSQDTFGARTNAIPLENPRIVGNTLRWRVPLDLLPKGIGVGVGTLLEELAADTRLDAAVVTAPQADEAYSQATFRIGS